MGYAHRRLSGRQFFPFQQRAKQAAAQFEGLVDQFALGLGDHHLIIYGTIGNVLGSLFNYGVGHLGRLDWVERYLHVKKKDLDKAQRFMAGRGAWMGFFAFLPILGSAITIMLGFMRSNFIISMLSITIGKLLRYVILVFGADLFI